MSGQSSSPKDKHKSYESHEENKFTLFEFQLPNHLTNNTLETSFSDQMFCLASDCAFSK